MSSWQVFTSFLTLGLTAFGGPIAHLAYFQRTFVQDKRWLTNEDYVQLVALCQILPGPTSSQVGMAIGLQQAGIRGAIAAWLGFTAPSVILLVTLAYGIEHFQTQLPEGLLHGLAIAAVAIVIQAVWSMSQTLSPDWSRRFIALTMALLALWLSSALWQLVLLALAAFIGVMMASATPIVIRHSVFKTIPTSYYPLLSLVTLLGLLMTLPLVANWLEYPVIVMIDHLFRAGALVFGGGHIVLPLLYDGFHELGISDDLFLAGYGIVQAMPGPLLSFSAFLATALPQTTFAPWLLAIIATVAMFLPSLLFVIIALPYWQKLMQSAFWQRALWGINAGVIGLLLAALVNPIALHALHSWWDAVWLVLAILLLRYAGLPIWAYVLCCTTISMLLNYAVTT